MIPILFYNFFFHCQWVRHLEDGSVNYIEGILFIFLGLTLCVCVLDSYPLSRYVGLMLCLVTGAKQPNYLVTADDVDTYLAIEVQPLDNRKRKVLFISLSLFQK